METPLSLLDQTIVKVENILEKKYPEFISFGQGSYTISRGSSQVMLIIRPFSNNETCVQCISHVVMGATITPELMTFLLRKNAEINWGAFGLLFDNTIVFSHSIAGANIDENELGTTIDSVAIIADHYDDEIVSLAGGKRAKDMQDL
ncbi:MAG: YbjN domain-containing protein [Candidatus Kapabacteria bacterium]|jgi:hypothetical protein|nr:YbjN domain-containing protein [Candidatus Kapabacteria bacterium]